jgi:sugar-specific transcriptional regulator TrmB
MSEAPAGPAVAEVGAAATTAAPTAVAPKVIAPAKPRNAIQVLEEQLQDFFKQKAQLIANQHAVEGAIQATNLLLGQLREEVAKAAAFAASEAKKIVTEIEGAAAEVATEAEKLFDKAEGK